MFGFRLRDSRSDRRRGTPCTARTGDTKLEAKSELNQAAKLSLVKPKDAFLQEPRN